MKRTILSALTVLVASTAVAPIAAAESANFNIQAQRLEALDRRTKTTVEHKIQLSISIIKPKPLRLSKLRV